MKRLIVVFVILAAVAPAAAMAAPSPDATTSAKTTCSKLKAQMGVSPFAQAFPTFGTCVSHYAPVEQQSITSAQAACSTLQSDSNFAAAHGGKSFDQYYGTGKGAKNAFGNCVSAVAKANAQAEQQGRVNPARSCRATRTQLTASVFASTYGKNAGDKNAFGKCVARVAAAQIQNELSASAACKAEQADAFGKCVSSKAKTASDEQRQATVTAARACATESNAGAAAFKAKYATFGRCVSLKAKG